MTRLASIILLSSTLAVTAIPSAIADVSVAETEGQWQVTADGDRLSEILQSIQSQAGFRLVGADRLTDDPVITIEVSGTLDDVLARLLTGFDYALVYGESPETENQLQRVVLLSGRAGEAPDESQRLSVERLQPEFTEEDGERVSELLQRQVQPLIDAESDLSGEASGGGTMSTAAASPSESSPSSNDGDGSDNAGDGEIDPATQEALAEATRRAQQDLQALVNALRAAENDND